MSSEIASVDCLANDQKLARRDIGQRQAFISNSGLEHRAKERAGDDQPVSTERFTL